MPLIQQQINFHARKLRSCVKNKENIVSPKKNDSADLDVCVKPVNYSRRQTRKKLFAENTSLNHDLSVPRKTYSKLNNLKDALSSSVSRESSVSPSKRSDISLNYNDKLSLSPSKKLRDDPSPLLADVGEKKRCVSSVIGRDQEISTIRIFLQLNFTRLNTPNGDATLKKRSLYISGAPGTGKTASVNSILTELSNCKDDVMKCKIIFVNCMMLSSSVAVYTKIANELKIKIADLSERQIIRVIEKAFSGSVKVGKRQQKKFLLILDEIDQLDNKDSEVLYTIFQWPFLSNSRVVLIGIANALNFTEKILPRLENRQESLCPQQLCFSAYSRDQIEAIINEVVLSASKNNKVTVRPEAVQMLARKVSAVSGDVRKALDVVKRAVLVAIRSTPSLVTLPLILRIWNEVYGSRVDASALANETDRGLPLQQKLLLSSLLLLTKGRRHCDLANIEAKEVTLGRLQEVYSRICKKRQVACVVSSEICSLCDHLAVRGLVSVVHKSTVHGTPRTSKIKLSVDALEVADALRDKTLLSDILSSDFSCLM